jgi:hypothetical protein
MNRKTIVCVLLAFFLVAGGFWPQTSHADGWEKLPGAAVDVGAAPNGIVRVIGTGFGSYQWNYKTRNWDQKPETGVEHLSLDPAGNPWFVGRAGFIWFNKAVPAPKAKDIGVGLDGTVWIIGVDGSIQRLNKATGAWTKVEGGAVNVAVTSEGNPVVVNAGGQIFFWKPAINNWVHISGTASDITVSGSTVIVCNGTGVLYRRPADPDYKGDWVPEPLSVDANLQRVSAAPDGSVWAVAADKSIWRFGKDLQPFKGGATVRFRMPNGKYWSVNNPDWQLKPTADKPGFWETFTISSIDCSLTKVALQSQDGKFLSFRWDRPPSDFMIYGGVPHLQGWEKFDITIHPKDTKGLPIIFNSENSGKKFANGFFVEFVPAPPKPSLETFSAANDLTCAYVKDYTRVWCSKNQGPETVITVGRPKLPDGWVFLGDVIGAGEKLPTSPTLIMRDHPVLAKPVDFRLVWADWRDKHPSGSEQLGVWYPVPPPGYVSLGTVVTKTGVTPQQVPEIANLRCVRTDSVMTADWAPEIWNSDRAGTKRHVGLVGIAPPSNDRRKWDTTMGDASALLTGTFKAIDRNSHTAFLVWADEKGGGYFKDFAPPGTVLVGLDVRQGWYTDGVKALFRDPGNPKAPVFTSPGRGGSGGGQRVTSAKPGYAVGNTWIDRGGKYIDGLVVVYMKLENGKLNNKDRYGDGDPSCRFEGRGGGRWQFWKADQEDGDVIAGIRGFCGEMLDGFGLVEADAIPYVLKGLSDEQLKAQAYARAFAETQMKNANLVAEKVNQAVGKLDLTPVPTTSTDAKMQEIAGKISGAKPSTPTPLPATPQAKDELAGAAPVHPISPPIIKPMGEYKAAVSALEKELPSAPPAVIAIQGNRGNHISATPEGKAVCSPNLDLWETFTVVSQGGNKVALRTHHEKYLRVNSGAGNALAADGNSPTDSMSVFEVISHGNNSISLKSVGNGKLLCQDQTKKDALLVNRDTVGAWEKFVVINRDTKKADDPKAEILQSLFAKPIPPNLKISSVPGLEDVAFLKDVKITNGRLSSGDTPQPWVCLSGEGAIKFPQYEVIGGIPGKFFALSQNSSEGLKASVIFFPSQEAITKSGIMSKEPLKTLAIKGYVLTYAPNSFSCDFADLPGEVQQEFRNQTVIEAGTIIFEDSTSFVFGCKPQDVPVLRDILKVFLDSVNTMVFTGTRPKIPTDPMRLRASLQSGFNSKMFPPGCAINDAEIEFRGLQIGLLGKLEVKLSNSIHLKDLGLRIDLPKLNAPAFDNVTVSALVPGEWKNPLGIQGLTLKGLILSGQFGKAPGVGIKGTVDFGRTLEMAGAVSFTSPVAVSLLSAKVDQLSFADLISGVTSLIRQGAGAMKLPDPGSVNIPAEIMCLSDVDVTLALAANPAFNVKEGLTIRGKMTIAGADIGKVDVRVVPDKGLYAKASIAKFSFGPLQLTGAGPDGKMGTSDDCPYLDIEVFIDTQAKPPVFVTHAFISGKVDLVGVLLDLLFKMDRKTYTILLAGKVGGVMGIGLEGDGPIPTTFNLGQIGSTKLKGFVEAPYVGKLGLDVMDQVKKIPGVGEALTFISGNVFSLKEISLVPSIDDLSKGVISGVSAGCRILGKDLTFTIPDLDLKKGPAIGETIVDFLKKEVADRIIALGLDIGKFFKDVGEETAKVATTVGKETAAAAVTAANHVKDTGVVIGKTFENLGVTVGNEAKKFGLNVGNGFVFVGNQIGSGVKDAVNFLKKFKFW